MIADWWVKNRKIWPTTTNRERMDDRQIGLFSLPQLEKGIVLQPNYPVSVPYDI